jgi:hypothetical protein
MGVHINLLKSRLMDSTLSFQNRLLPVIQSKKKEEVQPVPEAIPNH